MSKTDQITAVRIEATAAALVVVFEDRELQILWERCSPKLADATELERSRAELSPGGYGIHWPLIGEDLSIGGLARSSAASRH
ncbi:MAG: DUF2442 domain-containing protein [Planctomycetia bacterium]|nr:DUF2442 domain-containing protein [Planctomycetia bacterium]